MMSGADLLGIDGLTPGGIGIWSLVGLVLVALLKAWPLLAKLSIEARAQLRKEGREDLDDCKARLDKMEARLTLAEAHSHALDLKLVGAIGAYRIINAAHEAIAPNSSAAAQAKAVLQAAFSLSDDLPDDIASLLEKANVAPPTA